MLNFLICFSFSSANRVIMANTTQTNKTTPTATIPVPKPTEKIQTPAQTKSPTQTLPPRTAAATAPPQTTVSTTNSTNTTKTPAPTTVVTPTPNATKIPPTLTQTPQPTKIILPTPEQSPNPTVFPTEPVPEMTEVPIVITPARTPSPSRSFIMTPPEYQSYSQEAFLVFAIIVVLTGVGIYILYKNHRNAEDNEIEFTRAIIGDDAFEFSQMDTI